MATFGYCASSPSETYKKDLGGGTPWCYRIQVPADCSTITQISAYVENKHASNSYDFRIFVMDDSGAAPNANIYCGANHSVGPLSGATQITDTLISITVTPNSYIWVGVNCYVVSYNVVYVYYVNGSGAYNVWAGVPWSSQNCPTAVGLSDAGVNADDLITCMTYTPAGTGVTAWIRFMT